MDCEYCFRYCGESGICTSCEEFINAGGTEIECARRAGVLIGVVATGARVNAVEKAERALKEWKYRRENKD